MYTRSITASFVEHATKNLGTASAVLPVATHLRSNIGTPFPLSAAQPQGPTQEFASVMRGSCNYQAKDSYPLDHPLMDKKKGDWDTWIVPAKKNYGTDSY